MRLSRRALLNEVATLEAQLLAARAEPRVAATVLADNVRLAAQLEQTEMALEQERAMRRYEDVRLARFMEQHPDLFREAG